MLAAAEWLHCW